MFAVRLRGNWAVNCWFVRSALGVDFDVMELLVFEGCRHRS